MEGRFGVAEAGVGNVRAEADAAFAWYVIHTRSRHEAMVASALARQDLEIFLPCIRVPSRRRDRRVILSLPLFPGYLFCHSDLNPHTHLDIIRHPGVVRLLGVKGRAAPVPPETVESIRLMVAGDRPCYPWPFLSRGRRVRILDGPLTGAEGLILERRDKKRRLVVSVELFCRSVAVELAEDVVAPV